MLLLVNCVPAVMAVYLLGRSTQGYMQARRVPQLAPFWYRGLLLGGAVLIYWYSPLLQWWGAPNAVILITHGVQDALLVLMNYHSIVGWLSLDSCLSATDLQHMTVLLRRGFLLVLVCMALLLTLAIVHQDTEDGFHISYHPAHNLFLNGYRCVAFACSIISVTYANRYSWRMIQVTVDPLMRLSMFMLWSSRLLSYGVVGVGVFSLFAPPAAALPMVSFWAAEAVYYS